MIILGFVLLAVLALGLATLLLALIMLGSALGLQVMGWFGAPVVDVVTAVQLAAGAAFGLGLALALVGLISLAFPAVRALLAGLLALARFALQGLPLLAGLPPALRTAAQLTSGAAGLLEQNGTIATGLDSVGQKLIDASASLPPIPVPSFSAEPLWIETDENGDYAAGYIPKPIIPDVTDPNLQVTVPDLQVPTSATLGTADIAPVVTALSDSGTAVKTLGANAVTVGSALSSASAALNEAADLIDLLVAQT